MDVLDLAWLDVFFYSIKFFSAMILASLTLAIPAGIITWILNK